MDDVAALSRAFHAACALGDLSLAADLLFRGADPNYIPASAATDTSPLMLLARSCSHPHSASDAIFDATAVDSLNAGREETVSQLLTLLRAMLAAGADPDAVETCSDLCVLSTWAAIPHERAASAALTVLVKEGGARVDGVPHPLLVRASVSLSHGQAQRS